jgi:hypothetical protein
MNLPEASIVFQKARFDTSTSANLQGVVEEFIVTACGKTTRERERERERERKERRERRERKE